MQGLVVSGKRTAIGIRVEALPRVRHVSWVLVGL